MCPFVTNNVFTPLVGTSFKAFQLTKGQTQTKNYFGYGTSEINWIIFCNILRLSNQVVNVCMSGSLNHWVLPLTLPLPLPLLVLPIQIWILNHSPISATIRGLGGSNHLALPGDLNVGLLWSSIEPVLIFSIFYY